MIIETLIKKKSVSFSLDPKVIKELKEEAKSQGINSSQVVNALVVQWLKNFNRK